MNLTDLEMEYIKFVIKKPAYFTRESLGFLEGTSFEHLLESYELDALSLNEMFRTLLNRDLFKYELAFNGEVFGLQRYFYFIDQPQIIPSPFLIRRVGLYPVYLNEFFLPNDKRVVTELRKILTQEFRSQVSLIPVIPMVFLRDGKWSRIYYEPSQLEKPEIELLRDLGLWASDSPREINMTQFKASGTLQLSKALAKELDEVLNKTKGSIEYRLSLSPLFARLKEGRVVEEFIDLHGVARYFLRIKRTSESPKKVISRVLQNCFCAEAYTSSEEIFIDLRTFHSDQFYTLAATNNLPYEFSSIQVVSEFWPCNFHQGMQKLGIK
ncbi:MAG: hypothetical protein ACTSRW_11510 [Candidatus Helarchaeota archaeon]